MTLSPEIEAKGLRAYEQVGAFERLRAWRLPLGNAVLSMIPAVGGVMLWWIGHTTMAELNFAAAAVLAVGTRLHWMRLRARYLENLELLAELERTYGDQLPWVQVENHFAALEELKRELADSGGGR